MGAVIGSLGITPFGVKFTTDQVVLGLLAFLAIDALVERLDILSKIEEDVDKISKATIIKVKSDLFFKKREDLPIMPHLVASAKKEIFIAGITMDSTVGIAFNLKERMNQGCNIKILALNPYGKSLKFASNYYDISLKGASQRIHGNLLNMISVLSNAERGSYEIGVIDNIFPTGYLIVDPDLPNGWMNVQMYIYQTRVDHAPLFKLTKNDDLHWFSVFLNQYRDAWNSSTQFNPNNKVISRSAKEIKG
jgi:hypothetical protein